MDFYPKTTHQRASWMRPEHPLFQRTMPQVNRGQALIYSATPSARPTTSLPTYPYVQSAQTSAGLLWRESGNHGALPQKMCRALANVPTSVPQKEMDTLTFAGNIPLQPTCVKSSQVVPITPTAVAPVQQEERLTFVGSFTHDPHVTQDQLIALLDSAKTPASGCGASHGVSFTQSTLLNPSVPLSSDSGTMRHTHPSTMLNVLMAAQQSPVAFRHVMTSNETAAADGPLTFVGNFSLSPEAIQGQHNLKPRPAHVTFSGCVAQEGFTPRIKPGPASFGSSAHVTARAYGDDPTHPRSSAMQYTREECVRMLEYHHHMASYYKELKQKAELTQKMEASVCPDQLQSRRGGELGGEGLEEPPQKNWDDGTGGIVLPDDAIEKLDAIPGIWELAVEMGFLTVHGSDK